LKHRALCIVLAVALGACSADSDVADEAVIEQPAAIPSAVRVAPIDNTQAVATATQPIEAAPSAAPRGLQFISPAEESTVASPVEVCVQLHGTEGTEFDHVIVIIDPSGQEVRNLSALNASPIPPGDRYVHFDAGATCHGMNIGNGRRVLVGLIADTDGRPLNPQFTGSLSVFVE
jgi:hypothetical protein